MEPRASTLQVDSLLSEPPGKSNNTAVDSLSLLQQIFWTQELNRGLLHYRWILYQLSYQGNPWSISSIWNSLSVLLAWNSLFIRFPGHQTCMDFLLLLNLHDLSVIVPRLEFWRTPESTLKSLLFSSILFAFALLFSSLLFFLFSFHNHSLVDHTV